MSAKMPQYRRILLKISGEALEGAKEFGIDPEMTTQIADDIGVAVAMGVEVALVVGGGNIFRGVNLAAAGMDRVTGDNMGMLATVLNGLAMKAAIEKAGMKAALLSAIEMPKICETFSQRSLEHHVKHNRVVIFAAGTGNPYFTTDTAAALRAAEFAADALFKGTQVDGVYSADPAKDKSAVRYERMSHSQILDAGLKVMDAAAVSIARDNAIPIVVFSIHEKGGLANILNGGGRCTIVCD